MNTIHISKIEGYVPDDATHHLIDDVGISRFFYFRNGECYLVDSSGNTIQITKSNFIDDLQEIIRDPLPETYVPKVGEECLVSAHNSIWGFPDTKERKGIVIYIDHDHFWFRGGDVNCISRLDKCDFSPIQSEEDKKREEILEAWKRHGGLESAHDTNESVLTVREMIDFIMSIPESES